MIYGESNEWIWATPDPLTGHCPPGFGYNSWGCSKRKTSLGASDPTPSKGIWLGVAGLVLSAGIMIAMGFHKPVRRPARTRR
jgi:hypothetical protein